MPSERNPSRNSSRIAEVRCGEALARAQELAGEAARHRVCSDCGRPVGAAICGTCWRKGDEDEEEP